MTWFDHETNSIWSQPIGRAIDGPLLGVELFLLPVQLTTWESWRSDHPETLVMTDDINQMLRFRQRFQPDFLIGIVWNGEARAYRYREVEATGVVNDFLAGAPVLVWAGNESFQSYIRRTEDGQELTFTIEDGRLVDQETASSWDVVRGLAVDGPLAGTVLQSLPGLTAYENHWWDFYPDSTLYEP